MSDDKLVIMKGHFSRNGIRIVLHFTHLKIAEYIDTAKQLEREGWVQIMPSDEV